MRLWLRYASSVGLSAVILSATASAQAAKLEAGVFESVHHGTSDEFGCAVELDGSRLFVGASKGDAVGQDSGEVQIFDVGPPSVHVATLLASDVTGGDRFGSSISRHGDTLVIGAPRHDHGLADAGAAYVYRRSGGAWIEAAELLASDRAANDEFGATVDVYGEWIVVGAPGCDLGPGNVDRGGVYVFRESGGAWVETQKLDAWDGVARDRFGARVAIWDDVLGGASSMQFSTGIGAVHTFRFDGATWTDEQRFDPSPLLVTFGSDLDIEGDLMVIGHPYGPFLEAYRYSSGQWTYEARLEHRYGDFLDLPGFAVQIENGRIASGSPGLWFWDDTYGAIGVFERVGGVWTETVMYLPSPATMNAPHGTFVERYGFGRSIAFEGDRLVGGSWGTGAVVCSFDVVDPVGTIVCTGETGAPCPCGNTTPSGLGLGCANGFNRGASLAACGSASVASDDLTLAMFHLMYGKTVILGVASHTSGSGVPFGDGLMCIYGGRVRFAAQRSTPGTQGLAIYGPGLAAQGGWMAGDTRYFQAWYRDGHSACGFYFNSTNALEVVFTP